MNSDLRLEAEGLLEEFGQAWTYDTRDLLKPSTDKVLKELIEKRSQSIRGRLLSEFFGEGPLTELLADTSVNEIIVNGEKEIWFERSGQLWKLEDSFLHPVSFKGFIERLCAEGGLKVDLAQPFADGRWRAFRCHLTCAPLTHCSFHLTLRRTPDIRWTLAALAERHWGSQKQIDKIKKLLLSRSNLLVCGPTGSGKTTVLSACLLALNEDERIVAIEDTDELPRPNSASTKLLTRPESAQLCEVSLAELVRQSLRMRPSRLVVGEVRGPEAKDLLLALATGHSGSMGTLHASDPRQALLRLEMLVQLGAPQWQLQAVRQLIQLSIDALIMCDLKDGQRRLAGIYRLAALESVGFLLEPV